MLDIYTHTMILSRKRISFLGQWEMFSPFISKIYLPTESKKSSLYNDILIKNIHTHCYNMLFMSPRVVVPVKLETLVNL